MRHTGVVQQGCEGLDAPGLGNLGKGLGEGEGLEAWLKCRVTAKDWVDDLQKVEGG